MLYATTGFRDKSTSTTRPPIAAKPNEPRDTQPRQVSARVNMADEFIRHERLVGNPRPVATKVASQFGISHTRAKELIRSAYGKHLGNDRAPDVVAERANNARAYIATLTVRPSLKHVMDHCHIGKPTALKIVRELFDEGKRGGKAVAK